MRNPSDNLFVNQWHLDAPLGFDINVVDYKGSDDVWDDYTGRGVSVVVFDDGVQNTHPDLNRNYDANNDLNTYNNQSDGTPQIDDEGADSHGTAVAGLIAAERDGTGVVGVAYDATIVSFYGSSAYAGLAGRSATAINRAVGFDIMNNSWSYGNLFMDRPDVAFEDEFAGTHRDAGQALADTVINGRGGLGTIIVQSAGNTGVYGDNVNLHNYQNSRFTVTVAATDINGNIGEGADDPSTPLVEAWRSTPGASILVSAPGVRVWTTDRTGEGTAPNGTVYAHGYRADDPSTPGVDEGDHTASGGTSAAAPIVSGVVALMLEANPDLGWRDVQEILVYGARHPNPTDLTWQTNDAWNWNGGGLRMSHDYGAGLIDAHAAVRLAETWETTGTSADEFSFTRMASPNLAIPDASRVGGTSTIYMPANIPIDHVEVHLDITHPRIGDLAATLIAPDGTESVLLDRPGRGPSQITAEGRSHGSAQDDVDFVFSSTQHWGESSLGTWQLQVTDRARAETGQLNAWSLTVFGDDSRDDTYVFTDEFATFAPADASRGVIEADFVGRNTINAAAVTSNSRIDLTESATSFIAGQPLRIEAPLYIDVVHAGDGDDRLFGNAASNVLDGGRGDDVLVGGAGDDTLDGGQGSDTANFRGATEGARIDLENGYAHFPQSGEDDALLSIERVDGTRFEDTIIGDAGINRLLGLQGDDRISGGPGADVIDGGPGRDTVNYSDDEILIYSPYGSPAPDLGMVMGGVLALDLGAETATIVQTLYGYNPATSKYEVFSSGYGEEVTSVENAVGTSLNDVIRGTDGRNILEGGGGDDTLVGLGGDDFVWGGDGRNWLYGGANDDTLRGGDDNDLLVGESGVDEMQGGDGDDVYEVDEFADMVIEFPAQGTDTVRTATTSYVLPDNVENLELLGNVWLHGVGNRLDNFIVGNDAPNALFGREGSDILDGGAGRDGVFGGSGHDSIRGGEGPDKVYGGDGNDRLDGGPGNDILTGNTGSDAFIFVGSHGIDAIRDFDVTSDHLEIVGGFWAIEMLDQTFDGVLDSGDANVSYGIPSRNDTYYAAYDGPLDEADTYGMNIDTGGGIIHLDNVFALTINDVWALP